MSRLPLRLLGAAPLAFSVCLVALVPQGLTAQDALTEARRFRDLGDYRTAAVVLRDHLGGHPDDTDARWLLAHTLYVLGRHDEAGAEYLRAVDQRPGDPALRLDAVRVLFETGRYSLARRILAPLDAGAELPPHLGGQVRELRRSIALTTAPWLRLRPSVVHDVQPLTRIGAEIEGGAYVAPGVALALRAAPSRVTATALESEVVELEAGVLAAWPRARVEARVWGGAALRREPGEGDAIGRARLAVRLPQDVLLRGDASRAPYLWTARSLATALLVDSYEAALDRHAAPGWAGEAGVRLDRFPDGNRIRSGWAWFLAPLLVRPEGSLRLGYAFQARDSDESRFASSGIYDPYYTPEEEIVHSVVSAVSRTLASGVVLYADGSLGLHARERAPEDTLAFRARAFTPWRVRAALVADVGIASSVRLSLGHEETAFFSMTQASVEWVWRVAR